MTLIPQVGMFELMMLGILALIVVGPKDLPRLMNRVGKAVGQMRQMANEFRASFDQMAREAEIEEMRKEIETLKAANPVREKEDAVADVNRDLQTPLPRVGEPAAQDEDTLDADDGDTAVAGKPAS